MLTILIIILLILLLGGPYVPATRIYFGTPTNLVQVVLFIILIILIFELIPFPFPHR